MPRDNVVFRPTVVTGLGSTRHGAILKRGALLIRTVRLPQKTTSERYCQKVLRGKVCGNVLSTPRKLLRKLVTTGSILSPCEFRLFSSVNGDVLMIRRALTTPVTEFRRSPFFLSRSSNA